MANKIRAITHFTNSSQGETDPINYNEIVKAIPKARRQAMKRWGITEPPQLDEEVVAKALGEKFQVWCNN